MKTFDFNPTLTSAKLNEQFEKNFGGRVNLGKFSREQLEDMRNKVRTMVFQQESSAGYNDLLTNETYQKNQAMLQLLNTRIKEMLGEDIKKLRDKMDQLSEAKAKPDFLDMDKDGNKKEPMKKAVADKKKNPFAKVKEGAKPDYIDLDKDGNKKEPMKKAAKDAKVKETRISELSNDTLKSYSDKAKASAKYHDAEGARYDSDPDERAFAPSQYKKAASRTAGAAKADSKMKEEEEMKVGDKKKSSTGGTIEKTKTGVKHTAGKNYGAMKQPFDKNSKDLDEANAHDKDCECKECMGMYERDMGKHNNKTTGFKALAKKAGGGEKGQKIAGAQFQKMKKAGQLEEANRNFKHNVRFVNESLAFLINEDEEGKAKAITAASDIVNDFTSWMQRVGQYQTKSMIELADSIKANFGAAEAEQFKTSVAASLSQTLEVLTSQREAISGAVAVLAGEATPEAPMGQEPDMGMDSEMPPEDGMDTAEPDEMNPEPAGDEFGASDAAAGAGTTGREMRESREERRARRLAEEHSIIARLAK